MVRSASLSPWSSGVSVLPLASRALRAVLSASGLLTSAACCLLRAGGALSAENAGCASAIGSTKAPVANIACTFLIGLHLLCAVQRDACQQCRLTERQLFAAFSYA